MQFHEMLVLGLIVSTFVSFGVVLAVTCWYCRSGTALRRDARRIANYRSSASLITDED
jgi:hypothetical protein